MRSAMDKKLVSSVLIVGCICFFFSFFDRSKYTVINGTVNNNRYDNDSELRVVTN